MSLATLKTLVTMARGRRGGDHQESLEAFYAPQAEHYDSFRERLLQGRAELLADLDLQPGERVVELGGGTGRNLEFAAERIPSLGSVDLVDLCRPLLAIAEQRIAARAWQEVVRTHHADACDWQPTQPVDVVYCSYSLSMIPDWQRALDQALSWLRPGGRLGIVDFYVDAAHPWFTRAFWPRWFRHDGVHLRSEYLGALAERLQLSSLVESRARVPWCCGLRVPYLRAIGHPRAQGEQQ
ncbi:MAG: class I SAM-dependent methyltransferase [Planctomycetota bacterium]|nr:MAG: class I SAM-dependent methyltransferase [Planctomycetota bacterium]